MKNALFAIVLLWATSASADEVRVITTVTPGCCGGWTVIAIGGDEAKPAPKPPRKPNGKPRPKQPCAALENAVTACKAAGAAADCTAITTSLATCQAEAKHCAETCTSCWEAWVKKWGGTPVAVTGGVSAPAATAVPPATPAPPVSASGARPAGTEGETIPAPGLSPQ